MSSLSFDDQDKQLRELEAEIRIAQDSLATARQHLQNASVNRSNSKGTVLNSRDGRTVDSNKFRAEQYEKVFLDARANCKEIEDKLASLTKKRIEIKKEQGMPY
jgi:hypothetical protein